MIKVLFVCHGNICRSPMAEFILKDMTSKKGIAQLFTIASCATSREEIGNPVHHGARKKLKERGIIPDGKRAVQLTKDDYNRYDYLIGMDSRNITNIMKMLGGDPKRKVYRLLDFTERPGDIADPWYTGNFDETYRDICEGCEGLLAHLGYE
jgi:protein-tyrosine phosphatase